MIAQVDLDGNGKISIEGIVSEFCLAPRMITSFLQEFAALVERDS